MGQEKENAQRRKINEPSIVLIPDYTFADRVGIDNDLTGTFHKRCDIECESIWGYIGTKKTMGERCIGCGYTIWIDPTNGGIDDKRDKETIWNATKQTEEFLNKFGIMVEEVRK